MWLLCTTPRIIANKIRANILFFFGVSLSVPIAYKWRALHSHCSHTKRTYNHTTLHPQYTLHYTPLHPHYTPLHSLVSTPTLHSLYTHSTLTLHSLYTHSTLTLHTTLTDSTLTDSTPIFGATCRLRGHLRTHLRLRFWRCCWWREEDEDAPVLVVPAEVEGAL